MRIFEALGLGNPIYAVLYVDEKQKRRTEFQQIFRGDFHVHVAASGKEGMEILGKQTIQLVVANHMLSDSSGIAFLEQVMSEHPHATRIIQGSTDHMDEILKAVNRGIVFQFVEHPWKREELKITMDGAMELYFLKSQNQNLEKYLAEIRDTLEMKVLERTNELEQQKEKITDSIHYASRIQNALMLPPGELRRILPSHFLFYKPKDIVSGDFYWVEEMDKRLVVAVVDCTGHGVAGAFMSILGISLLNEIVANLKQGRASDILNLLRKEVIRALGQTGRSDEAKEGMEMSLCIIDFERRIIEFAGAYHPMYVVSEGDFKVFRGDRIPIGYYHDAQVAFSNQEIPFHEGDLIYLFTDGYVDQIGGLQRKTFRSVHFKKLIREIWDKPMDEQAAILREEHEIWRAGQEQIDDITVLGIKLHEL